MYFVTSRQRRAETVTCTCRVGDAAPQLWDDETGTISRPALFESDAATTRVVFDLSPAGSTFLMLARAHAATGVAWVVTDVRRFADVDAAPAAAAASPRDSFTYSLWATPDTARPLIPATTRSEERRGGVRCDSKVS